MNGTLFWTLVWKFIPRNVDLTKPWTFWWTEAKNATLFFLLSIPFYRCATAPSGSPNANLFLGWQQAGMKHLVELKRYVANSQLNTTRRDFILSASCANMIMTANFLRYVLLNWACAVDLVGQVYPGDNNGVGGAHGFDGAMRLHACQLLLCLLLSMLWFQSRTLKPLLLKSSMTRLDGRHEGLVVPLCSECGITIRFS